MGAGMGVEWGRGWGREGEEGQRRVLCWYKIKLNIHNTSKRQRQEKETTLRLH